MCADPQSFPDNFSRLTSHSPMRWQHRLFDQFIDGKIPTALDLPTGLGKTSVIAIWLLARAVAKEGALRPIPRRLVYVVDRRAVVDQATEEAEKLRESLAGDAEHLQEPLGLAGRKLPISTLRGAHADNREWLADPAAPAIIVGTIDMIGSRLLFEGYGISRKMRPFHAGLLGADALVVLDEAHLVPPFEALLRRIADGTCEFGPRTDGGAEIVPAFKLLPLSATGRAPILIGDAAEGAFRLEDSDLSDTIVTERLSAKKTLVVVKIGDEKDALAEALAQQAWKFSENGNKPRCLVYCDSRDVAEKVKDRLDKLAGAGKKTTEARADTELFVGARRVKEREDAKLWLQSHGFLAGSASPANPAFLIATSAGEVGIDLDADHMVCDLVPWERMVQRLGRVNRRGAGDASVVVVHGDQPKPKKPDSPTDLEVRQAVGFRSLAVIEELTKVAGGRDASPGALRALKLRAETDEALDEKIKGATTPEPLHPALTRALVDAWSMTSLENHTGRPEVAPWLRGWVDEIPQTTVVWRSHLPLRIDESGRPTFSNKKETNQFFDAAPPHESEKLETETFRVADWLQKRAATLLHRKPLKENVDPAEPEELPTDEAAGSETAPRRARELRGDDVVLLVLSPSSEYEQHLKLGDLARDRKGKAKDEFHDKFTGRTLVVDARFGGLNGGMLDDKEVNDPPTADACAPWSEEAEFRVRQATSDDYESKKPDWRIEDDFVLRSDGAGDPAEWLVVEHYLSASQSEEGRSISRQPQELAEHQSWVEQKAQCVAEKIGLSGHAAEALTLAAFLHDEGKRAPLWQRAFNASHDAKNCDLSGPLAKTTGWKGQLHGYRHEFGSLPYAQAHARFKALPEDWHDLVLHLIAAHHGHARPMIATLGCEDAPPSALEERARNVALRFAKLQKRWGPWGLAWWEALLRAADQQASRDNDKSEGLGAPQAEEK